MSTTAFTTCPGRLLPFLHRERRPRHCLNNHPCRHCPPSCPPRSKQPSSENRHKPSASITVWNQHNKGHAHICYPGPRPDVAVHHLLSCCWHRRPLTCCPPPAAAGASRASSRPALCACVTTCAWRAWLHWRGRDLVCACLCRSDANMLIHIQETEQRTEEGNCSRRQQRAGVIETTTFHVIWYKPALAK